MAAALALATVLCAAALRDENEGDAVFEDGPDAAAVADEADEDAAADEAAPDEAAADEDASDEDAADEDASDEAAAELAELVVALSLKADEAEDGLGVPDAERESAVCEATVLVDSRTK